MRCLTPEALLIFTELEQTPVFKLALICRKASLAGLTALYELLVRLLSIGLKLDHCFLQSKSRPRFSY
jgi:hypothetical protein